MNVVVTGGGTIAPIDDVRAIANTSTGRFSARIAEACLARGATVCHLHAPAAELPFARSARFDLATPDLRAEFDRLEALRRAWLVAAPRLHLVPLRQNTAAEYRMRLHELLTAGPVDVAFLAMAVSDFEPTAVAGKLESLRGPEAIAVRPTPKVIREVRGWAPGVYLVGFKLLSGVPEAALIRAAAEACRVNRADLTVANDLKLLQAGRHTIHLVRPGRPAETIGPPDDPAERLVDRAFAWAAARETGRIQEP